jgi:transposase
VCPHVGVEKPPVRPVDDRCTTGVRRQVERTRPGGGCSLTVDVKPRRRAHFPPPPASPRLPTLPHASRWLLKTKKTRSSCGSPHPTRGAARGGWLRDHPRGSSRERVLGPASERSHPPAGWGVGGEEHPVHAHGAVDRWVGRPEADTPPLARSPHAQVRSGGCRTWCARAKQRPACSRCAEDARQPGQHRWTALARNR